MTLSDDWNKFHAPFGGKNVLCFVIPYHTEFMLIVSFLQSCDVFQMLR